MNTPDAMQTPMQVPVQNPIQNNVSQNLGRKKWSLKKKITITVAIVLTFVAGIVLIANVATKEATKVSNELVSYIQDKNATAAYGLMSKEAKEATSASELSTIIDRIGPVLTGKPKTKSKEVSAETGRSSTAKVVYEIKGTDGLVYDLTVNLIKEDGSWKVLNFETVKQSGSSSKSSS